MTEQKNEAAHRRPRWQYQSALSAHQQGAHQQRYGPHTRCRPGGHQRPQKPLQAALCMMVAFCACALKCDAPCVCAFARLIDPTTKIAAAKARVTLRIKLSFRLPNSSLGAKRRIGAPDCGRRDVGRAKFLRCGSCKRRYLLTSRARTSSARVRRRGACPADTSDRNRRTPSCE